MKIELLFLDYIWKGLVLGGVTSSIFMILLLLSFFIFKRTRSLQMKWIFNIQFLSLMVFFMGGFLVIAIADPELLKECYNTFVKRGAPYTFTRIAAGLWLLSVAMLVFIDVIKVYFFVRQSKRFKSLHHPKLNSLWEDLKKEMNIKNDVRLYVVKGSVSPFVFGFLKKKVVISENLLETLDLSVLRNALAHELIHIRDFDSLWMSVELLCRRLLFFNPMSYVLGQLYVRLVEKAADEEAVIRAKIQPKTYVQSLLSVLESCNGSFKAPLSLHVSRNYSEIKDRIERVIKLEGDVPGWRGWLYLVSILTLSLGLSMAQAKTLLTDYKVKTDGGVLMCSQVEHELMIESWFKDKSEPILCE